MALAAEDFAALVDSMGLAGTAADNLDGILQRLAATTAAEAVATRAAAAVGVSAAQLRSAMTAATNEAAEANKKLEAAAAAQQKSDQARIALSGTLESVVGKATGGLEKLGAAGLLSGEQVAAASAKVTQWAAALGPYAAAAAAAIAVVSYLGEKLWDLGKAAVSFTQEDDALRATFDVFTGGGGQGMMDHLDELAEKLPFATGKLEVWAKSLLAAGISGDALDSSINAIAAATAIMGESGGAAAEGLIKRFAQMAEAGQKVKLDRRILAQLAAAGVSVQALSKALGKTPEELGKTEIAAADLGVAMQNALIQNGAKSLAMMGQTWASMSDKLADSFEDAFANLGDLVGPFMRELQSLASEFFKGGTASTGFAGVIRAVLTPAFEVATRSIRALHIAYLVMLIAFLKASIFLAPLTSVLDKIGISGGVVTVAMYLLVGAAVVLAGVLGVLALAVFLVALPFIMVAAVIYGVGSAISYLYGLLSGAAENFDNLKAAALSALSTLGADAMTAAGDFVAGLVGGIASGTGAVAAAVKGLAAGALGAFTSFFGIASPSKVMRKHGKENIAEDGLAEGIDQGADAVDRAMNDLAAPPKAKGGAGGKGAPTRIVRIEAVNFYGPASDFPSFREQANAWLEEIGASGPEPEPA